MPNAIKNDPYIHFSTGIPNFESIPSDSLVIIDDLMSSINQDLQEAFTRHSSHRKISIILNVQNLFYNGGRNGLFRNISLNCTSIILTRNMRDRRQVLSLANQLKPNNVKFVLEAYNDATVDSYSYLLFDLFQGQDDIFQLRARIMPDERPQIVYIEKHK